MYVVYAFWSTAGKAKISLYKNDARQSTFYALPGTSEYLWANGVDTVNQDPGMMPLNLNLGGRRSRILGFS